MMIVDDFHWLIAVPLVEQQCMRIVKPNRIQNYSFQSVRSSDDFNLCWFKSNTNSLSFTFGALPLNTLSDSQRKAKFT